MSARDMDDGDITALLTAASAGDRECQSRLFELVYRQLRSMAAAQLRNERPGHTLQPSALVNEAYLKLLGRIDLPWANRAHFFATAAGTMRRILIDYARTRRAQKRDGALKRVDLDDVPALFADEDAERLLAVDAALDKLADWDERQAKVVELKFFAGLSTEEIAQVLNVSERTVKRDWNMARAWLLTQLGDQSDVG